MTYRINTALRTIGWPPLIVDPDDPGTERMGKWAARLYVAGFFGVYIVGGLGAAAMLHR
jgi:hypothetical protein